MSMLRMCYSTKDQDQSSFFMIKFYLPPTQMKNMFESDWSQSQNFEHNNGSNFPQVFRIYLFMSQAHHASSILLVSRLIGQIIS